MNYSVKILRMQFITFFYSVFHKMPHLLVQCLSRTIHKIVKVGENRFDIISHLVTRAAFFASGKMEIFAISDPFIDLNFMFCMFQYDSTYGKFNGTVEAENGKIVINMKAITFF